MDRMVSCPYCGGEYHMRFIKSYTATSMKGYFLCENCHSRSPKVRHEYIDGESFTDRFRIGGCARTAGAVEDMALDACGIYAEIVWGEDHVDNDEFAEVLS